MLRNSIKKEFDNELVYNEKYLDPIQDGQGGGKQATPPPTSFSPVTSTNLGMRHQNFLTFSFNTFSTLV